MTAAPRKRQRGEERYSELGLPPSVPFTSPLAHATSKRRRSRPSSGSVGRTTYFGTKARTRLNKKTTPTFGTHGRNTEELDEIINNMQEEEAQVANKKKPGIGRILDQHVSWTCPLCPFVAGGDKWAQHKHNHVARHHKNEARTLSLFPFQVIPPVVPVRGTEVPTWICRFCDSGIYYVRPQERPGIAARKQHHLAEHPEVPWKKAWLTPRGTGTMRGAHIARKNTIVAQRCSMLQGMEDGHCPGALVWPRAAAFCRPGRVGLWCGKCKRVWTEARLALLTKCGKWSAHCVIGRCRVLARLAEHMKADPHDLAAKDAYDKLLIPKGFFATPKAKEIYEEGLRIAADPCAAVAAATSAVQQ